MENKKISSKELYERAKKVLTGGISRNTIFREPHPNYVQTAQGSYITDIDGHTRVDFANNMASLIHGHSNQEIINAVTKQLCKGTAYTMGSIAEVKFAELLTTRNNNYEKIRFMNSGTEAVMTMIKASRAFNGKSKIAKAEGTYHGTYDYAEISQISNPKNWGPIENPNSNPVVSGTPHNILNDVIIFPFNDTKRTIDILERNKNDITCVLLDLVPHRVGLMPIKDDYLTAIYNWTRKNNSLLVFDEVVTYRANYSGAQQNFSIVPDLTAMGKIIGGGFPIGALAGKSEVMEVLNPRNQPLKHPHSGTFSANPISTTAGYVAMKLFDKKTVEELNLITGKAIKQIEEAIAIADIPACITGMGSMFRIHLKETKPTNFRETYQDKKTLDIIKHLLDFLYHEKNIIMINTLSCMFATTIHQKEIDILSEGLLDGFKKIKPLIEK